jgi:outer membrane protein assembly factor BamE (lipoprotein component of BamABCDE complex)
MAADPLHSTSSALGRAARSSLVAWPLLFAGTTACVTENTTTGEMVPRGNQSYPWDKVKQLAQRLEKGMVKGHVQMLMGSPAEKDEGGNEWVYLPERYAILIPAEALHLEFKDSVLVDFGYRPIVLGAQL